MFDVCETLDAINITSLNPQDLLKLNSINRIPIDTLNEPFFSYNDPFRQRTVYMKNPYAFLPEGLHVLGITDRSVDYLRAQYKKP